MDSFTTSVAASVAQAIASSGESQVAVAEHTGIPRTTLLRRLSGVTPFTVAELHAIATMLDLDVRSLVDVTEEADAS